MEYLKTKDEYKEEEKDRSEKLAKELESMSDKDMDKMRWIMQGIKIARSAWGVRWYVMKREDLISLLNFRKKFTIREWFEINSIIENRVKEKADKLVLDDFDIDVILERIEKSPWLKN